MIEAVIGLVVAGVGAAAGWNLAQRRTRQLVAEGRGDAERLLAEAAEVAALTRRESDARAREQVEQIRVGAEAEEAAVSKELTGLGELLDRREGRIDQRHTQLDGRLAAIDEQLAAVGARKAEAKQVRQQAKQVRRDCKKQLEHQAGLTAVEVAEQLVEQMVERTREQCADRLRNLESTGAEEFGRQAKRVMGIVMQRYTGHCVRERSAMTMSLPAGAADKLQGAAAETTTKVSEAIGVPFAFSEDGGMVRLESGNGVARELGRRALTKIAGKDQIQDVEGLVESLGAELHKEIMRTGRRAFHDLRLKKIADDEIVELVGKLIYRTSYTQNQWRHAVEAGHLAGMMAEELGIDRVIARRGALMHDIGKALTHEVDGSHALIGAEIARRCGEHDYVANAIGFHHGEEASLSAFAPLVAAADAMSGDRPGARREMVESYGDRIGDLEKLAGGFSGVTRVHAVQAGREIRVHVDEGHVSDDQIADLSTAIAEKISAEMTFPGQIRVTVIREFCAVEFAN